MSYLAPQMLSPLEFKMPDFAELARELRKAMKGVGTDEEVITKIVGSLSYLDLQRLVDVYSKVIGRNLINDIEEETSGKYRVVVKALLTERTTYDAELLYNAMKGLGTDDECLIELLCTRSPAEVKAMLDLFNAKYSKDPIQWIESETSGSYRKLLKHVITMSLTGDRSRLPPPSALESELAKDCKALYDAGEGKIGTDDQVFINIIGGRPREYVERLSDFYCRRHGKLLEAVINSEASFSFKKALIALVSPLPEWYAERLYKAMKGVGTNDNALIRYLVIQKNRLLRFINSAFLFKYKSTLRNWIHDDTSGEYRSVLKLTVINFGEERAPQKLY